MGRLVRDTVSLLTSRLVVRRQEILTLGSALQLAWALACLPRAMWWDEHEALARRPTRRLRRLRRAARPEAPDDGIDDDDGDGGDDGNDAALGDRTCWQALRQKYWRLRGVAGGGGRLFPAMTVSAPRLLTFAASKVLGSPPDALNDKPRDLRRLVEIYGLLVSPEDTHYYMATIFLELLTYPIHAHPISMIIIYPISLILNSTSSQCAVSRATPQVHLARPQAPLAASRGGRWSRPAPPRTAAAHGAGGRPSS